MASTTDSNPLETVDGLTRKQIEYNVYAIAKMMSQIERKLERARSEKVVKRLEQRWDDEKMYWESNVRRLVQLNSK